jgi:hypothetical protein
LVAFLSQDSMALSAMACSLEPVCRQ